MAARKTLLVCTFAAAAAFAQVPDSPSPPPASAPSAPAAAPGSSPVGQNGGSSAPAPSTAASANKSPFGQEVPVFDPGSEVLTFNGKNWNVTNNRIFQARFEKFLNAPEATNAEE